MLRYAKCTAEDLRISEPGSQLIKYKVEKKELQLVAKKEHDEKKLALKQAEDMAIQLRASEEKLAEKDAALRRAAEALAAKEKTRAESYASA